MTTVSDRMTLDQAREAFPRGAYVDFQLVRGEAAFTRHHIRSEPWALGHGQVVVLVTDRAGAVAVEHLSPVTDIDHEWTDIPVCPWCGFRDDDWWDGTSMDKDGDTEVQRCGNCERDYEVSMSISPDFNTKKLAEVPND